LIHQVVLRYQDQRNLRLLERLVPVQQCRKQTQWQQVSATQQALGTVPALQCLWLLLEGDGCFEGCFEGYPGQWAHSQLQPPPLDSLAHLGVIQGPKMIEHGRLLGKAAD
jgi:hypothetical protein